MRYDNAVPPRPLDRFVAWAWVKIFGPHHAAAEPTEALAAEDALDLEQDDSDVGPERKAA